MSYAICETCGRGLEHGSCPVCTETGEYLDPRIQNQESSCEEGEQ